MIDRYSYPEMVKVWSDEHKYDLWFQLETKVCRAMEKLGTVPPGTASAIESNTKINIKRILELESIVRHDVIAFLSHIEEQNADHSRWLHLGLTSSDITDTAFSILLNEALSLIEGQVCELLDVIRELAYKHKFTMVIGRSHGMHAEPTTFGLIMASFYSEFKRNQARLNQAREDINVCKFSGPVGNFSSIDPLVEVEMSLRSGMSPEPAASQIINRDRHAYYFSVLALVGTSIERLALQIRHWQRSEVGEVEEPFSPRQKGSSAMPHKHNPIISENLTGLARMLRGYAQSAMENVALWHERDISHSSVERFIGPDSTSILYYMLKKTVFLLKNMRVNSAKMAENLNKSMDYIHSQKLLLALTTGGTPRQEAYTHIQNALKSGESLEEWSKRQIATSVLVDKVFNGHQDYTKHVDYIFERTFV